jgi:hypothetical protein
MKANKKFSSLVLASLVVTVTTVIALSQQLPAQTAASQSGHNKKASAAPQWSVQVDKIDPGNVELASSFQIAIYENLFDELTKTKRFKQVFRSGDHDASSVPDLLILKTAVQAYTAGSEKKRAVTTVTGATKLNVRSQLCTRDGKVVLERVVDGNVRFIGSNLRATLNLARNVAKEIKQSPLPDPSPSTMQRKSEGSRVAMSRAPLR